MCLKNVLFRLAGRAVPFGQHAAAEWTAAHSTTVVVFATSFLDELQTHPPNECAGHDLLAGLRDSAGRPVRVEYRCDRDPGRPMTAAELEGVEAVIADLERYDAALFESCGVGAGGSLALVARYGAGYDAVDIAAAERNGVIVCNTPGANARPTAEWAVATLLAVAGRRLSHHRRASAGLLKEGPSRLDVTGRTVGIVGTGAVGRIVASLLRGFRPTLIASDPAPDEQWAGAAGVQYVPLGELCERADFITLHAAAGSRIIDASLIERMRPTTSLINCARSILVDNRAVYAAVTAGRLWGYGMDDPWTESDLPLDGVNIVVSPHVGSDTDDGKAAMRVMSARAVVEFFAGKTPTFALNRPRGS